ncbi:hypothetical protein ES708_09196 [subsurface metagenome]
MNSDKKIYPETLYYGKRISAGGGQPVFSKLLPDGIPTELSPVASQKLRNHSPDGFQWGYGGSGPAQLALALLLDATMDPEMAQAHYQNFKFFMVASWGEGWSITRQEILDWLKAEQRSELQRSFSTN